MAEHFPVTDDEIRKVAHRPPLVDGSDIFNAASFLVLAPVAWLLPERAWPTLARMLARLHIALRGSSADRLRLSPVVNMQPEVLERTVLAGRYEETMQTLREHRAGGWKASMQIEGIDHLSAATAHGAVLWIAACNFAELNVKKAVHAAGFRVVNLRSHVHPYSGTRFGRRVLNPVRTSIENRYLADTVTLNPQASAAALRELQLKLGPGILVTVTANSAGERSLAVPFLGGMMHVALGAATLARVARVPLLPVFARPRERGAYVIEIRQPLQAERGTGGRRRDEQLGRAFARELEAFVQRYPGVWRGWFNRYQWQPQAPAMRGEREHRAS